MLENNYLKWIGGDAQLYEIIFRNIDMIDLEKRTNKIVWNPFRETFTTLKELEFDSDIIDWTCGICNSKIKSRTDSKKVENLVCKKCQRSHNSTNKTVDNRIIESSIKFNKHCKKLLKKEQREFLDYLKKSSK